MNTAAIMDDTAKTSAMHLISYYMFQKENFIIQVIEMKIEKFLDNEKFFYYSKNIIKEFQ